MVSDELRRELSEVPVPGVSRQSIPALSGLLEQHRQAARDAEWPTLLSVSLTLLGAAQGHGAAVRAVRTSDAGQAQGAAAGVDELLSGLTQLAARPDHVQQADGIRVALQAAEPALAQRAGPLLDMVAAGVIDSAAFTEGRALVDELGQAPGTELDAALCVAAVTRGLLGLGHAVFASTRTDAVTTARTAEQLARLASVTDGVDASITAAEQALFGACAGGDPDTVAAQAGVLVADVQEVLVPFVALQARGHALVAALRAEGRNGDAEEVGHVLAHGGWLVRRAVAGATTATRLVLDLPLRVPPPIVADLMATDVAFATELPDGRNVPLAHLGPAEDGDFVEVAGFVTEASAAREPDGKLVGRIGLLDPSSDAVVDLAVLFLHPAHVGITLDAYVVAHGSYRTSSARLDGGPGVEVDTLAPVALARQSWQARLWFAAGPWLDLWRSHQHLRWSVGGHTAGPDESEAATRGAAELIFTPFTRTEDL